ncbi:MAG: class I SAM-dependent methyltransferase [Planctomycetota bacterium]|jgi:C-methyltransferase
MADNDPIFEILGGYRLSAALWSAMQLGLFTSISKGKKTAEAIASDVGAASRGVRILLDALLITRLVTKKGSSYSLSALAKHYLVEGEPDYMGDEAFLHVHPDIWSAFATLAGAARKGGSVVEPNAQSPEQPYWEDFARRTVDAARRSAAKMMEVLRIGPGAGPMKVLDVACGSGMYGVAVAEANPDAEVTLQDRADVLAHTRRNVAATDVADRVRYLEGDFFDADLGGPYDLVLISHLLRHFGKQECGKLVKRLAKAMRRGGRFLLQEFVVDDARLRRRRQLQHALMMLAWTEQGETYSFGEIRRLLIRGGFRHVEFHRLGRPAQFVTAHRS